MSIQELSSYNLYHQYLCEFAGKIDIPEISAPWDLSFSLAGGEANVSDDNSNSYITLYPTNLPPILLPCSVGHRGKGNCAGAVVETLLRENNWHASFPLDELCLWVGCNSPDAGTQSERIITYAEFIAMFSSELVGRFREQSDRSNNNITDTLLACDPKPGDIVVFWGFPSIGGSVGRAYDTHIPHFEVVHTGIISSTDAKDFYLDHKPGCSQLNSNDPSSQVVQMYPNIFAATVHRPHYYSNPS